MFCPDNQPLQHLKIELESSVRSSDNPPAQRQVRLNLFSTTWPHALLGFQDQFCTIQAHFNYANWGRKNLEELTCFDLPNLDRIEQFICRRHQHDELLEIYRSP